MSITDIPAVKAPAGERPDNCLHCAIMKTLEAWFTEYGRRAPGGQVIIDLDLVIAKLAECMVEHTEHAQGRTDRRRAFRFAHASLDAALKSAKTGKLVAVDIPQEH